VRGSTLQKARKQGFTLIELSIVLVIIGLIVGGILVGQSLIGAAAARATVAQIEKYNQAVNTFRGKYGYLPGDIRDPDASSFGFAARGLYPGEGDGNFLIEGVNSNGPGQNGNTNVFGETAMFWVDLSQSRLIEGGFNTASPSVVPATPITGSALNLYYPQAKLGGGNYVYVWSGGAPNSRLNGLNYFGIAAITEIGQYWTASLSSTPGLTVAQAYNIDKKVDDGLPQSGRVLAWYINEDALLVGLPSENPNTATSGSLTTCSDNGNVGGATQQYSMEESSGSGVNCALSFQFQ